MSAAEAQPAPAIAPRRGLAYTLSMPQKAAIMFAIVAATIMEVLDTSIVNVALPDMMGNLGATLDQIGWVATGYIISNVIILPLTGWLSDFFGRKKYLFLSVCLFTLASFMCGTSRTLSELVLWRIVQGMGGAAFLSTAQATLMEIFRPDQRGFAQALFGIGVIAAPTLGPTLGGFITDRFTWPWIFFVNVPVGIAAAALTLLYVPDSPDARARRTADFVGIGFLALGLGALQTVLERGEADDWLKSNFIAALALTAFVGTAMFIWWELRPGNRSPAVDLRVLKNRNMAAGTVFAFALGFALYGGVFALPQFFQNVQGYTAEKTGLLLMPGGLASAAMMPVVGQLSNRMDKRRLIFIGNLIFIMAMYQFAVRITLTAPANSMYWPLILRGSGVGLQFVPLSLVALGTLPARDLGSGAGLYNLARQLGGSLGIAMLATLVDRRMKLHYARLSDHVSIYHPATQHRLAAIEGFLRSSGKSPADATAGAYSLLNHSMMAQAATMTYADVFHMMAWVGMGVMVLLLLFERPARRGGGAPVH
ncbi:MAG: DHA2 family efflux MFS transporter permease subunit [Armatimonadetes bacterium]|nr:DHA2 family efflux MFS transporter permease subunit [Armatimonadota bacterium]MDE2206245.1 DHA2 family efflux MFS transporter permease subunit [Armatimonadota bacterium]